jgi:acetyl-CoA carboxylase alpha subunit
MKQLSGLSSSELIERRFDRLMSYGRFKEQAIS